jgi:hypothetical protein
MITKVSKPSDGKEEAQKTLATATYNHGFNFFSGIGKYTGETTVNLFSFDEELKTIEPDSIMFHFQRRGFQNWIMGQFLFLFFLTNLTTRGA